MSDLSLEIRKYFLEQMRSADPQPRARPWAEATLPNYTFTSNLIDNLSTIPVWNAVWDLTNVTSPIDADFHQNEKVNLIQELGMEKYAGDLLATRNRTHFDWTVKKIKGLEETKQRLDQQGSFLNAIVSEIGNPINYVTFGAGSLVAGSKALAGATLSKGAARAIATNLPSQMVDEALRQGVDPTATAGESALNIVAGTFLVGAVGSLVGKYGTKALKDPDFNLPKVADDYVAEVDKRSRPVGSKPQPDPVDIKEAKAARVEPETPVRESQLRAIDETSPGAKVVRPNRDEVYDTPTGISGRWRIQSLDWISRTNAYGKLTTSGDASIETLGHQISGTNTLITNRNALLFEPSEINVAAATDVKYKALATQTVLNIRQIWSEYLGDGVIGRQVLGADLRATTRAAADFARELIDRPNPDGKLSKKEFEYLTIKSFQADRIEAPSYRQDGITPLTQDERKYISRAATEAADLNRELGMRSSKDGYWFSPETKIRQLDAYRNEISNYTARLGDLSEKTNKTPNDRAEIEQIQKSLLYFANQIDEQSRFGNVDEIRLTSEPNEYIGALARTEQEIRDDIAIFVRNNKIRQYIDKDISNLVNEFEQLDNLPPHLFDDGVRSRMENIAEQLRKYSLPETAKEKQDEIIALKKAYPNISKTNLWLLQYLNTKLDSLAKARENIAAGKDSFEDMSRPHFGIRYRSDAIIEDDAGPQIFRNKLYLKFYEDSKNVNFARERKNFAIEKGYEKAESDVSRALVSSDKDAMPSIFREIEKLQDELYEFRKLNRSIPKEQIEAFKKSKDNLRSSIGRILEETGIRNKTKEELEELSLIKKPGDRIDGLIKKLAYLRHAIEAEKLDSLNPAIMEQLKTRVDKTMTRIKGEAELGELSFYGSNSFARRRLNFSPSEVADFIVTDIEPVLLGSASRLGSSASAVKILGDRDGRIGISRALAAYAKNAKGKSYDEIKANIEMFDDQATHLLSEVNGDIWKGGINSLSRKAARFVTEAGQATTLENSGVTSLATDSLRLLVIDGFRGMQSAFEFLTTNANFKAKMNAETIGVVGESLEYALASTTRGEAAFGGGVAPGVGRFERYGDKFSGFVKGPFMMMTGLPFVTSMQKQTAAAIGYRLFIETAIAIANGGGSSRNKRFWAQHLMTPEDARAIKELVTSGVIEKTEHLYLPNMRKWQDDDLMVRFAIGVKSWMNRAIVTASAADIPNPAKGFIGYGKNSKEIAMMRVPFGLTSFSFAATNRILLSGLQGQDASWVATVASLMAGGYLLAYLRTPDSIWKNQSYEERLINAFEKSGVLGIITDIPRMMEQASAGRWGIRSSLGFNPVKKDMDTFDAIKTFTGPGGGIVVDGVKLMIDGPNMSNRDMAKTVIGNIPMTGFMIWKDILNDLGEGSLDLFREDR